jgi:hypothetical protein
MTDASDPGNEQGANALAISEETPEQRQARIVRQLAHQEAPLKPQYVARPVRNVRESEQPPADIPVSPLLATNNTVELSQPAKSKTQRRKASVKTAAEVRV